MTPLIPLSCLALSMDQHSHEFVTGACSSLRTESSSSSLSMDEDNNYLQCLPEQMLENISVSDILNKDYEHNGFLYKRAQEKMTDQITEFISSTLLSKWQLRYVILYHEYVLYYKNEKCIKPKGVFSLRGYNRVVRAEDMTSANQKWAFKIIGLRSDDRTWYFSAASEREMRLWMAYIKVTMEKAIHGIAREKSLRILKDLQYNERKFLSSESASSLSISASSFEPGIYEDIEEPLEEMDYLPPKLGLSINRQLPVPPRSASLEQSRTPVSLPRGRLPLPPRPEQVRRGLGCRTQSDPTPPPQRRDRTISRISTPKARHRSSAPMSPGSRPKFPEPHFMKFQQSTLSTESGDYIQPQEADSNEIQQFRNQHGSQSTIAESSPTRQSPRRCVPLPQISSNKAERQGPEGNSFRKKQFVEIPPEMKDLRAALKPVVPIKPDAKPKLPVKPETPLKPKPAARVAASKEPAFRQSTVREPAVRDLLPASSQFNSSDKRTAEGLLNAYSVNGMYLLRLSAGPGKVLMVHHKNLNQCKHYKVFGNEVDTFSLTTEPIFSDMQHLLQHYSNNPLPNTGVQLSEPYPGET